MNESTERSAVEPKCPDCGAEGIEHFGNRESEQFSRSRDPWFFVIFCKKCGHVYNVIAKHVFSQSSTRVYLDDRKQLV